MSGSSIAYLPQSISAERPVPRCLCFAAYHRLDRIACGGTARSQVRGLGGQRERGNVRRPLIASHQRSLHGAGHATAHPFSVTGWPWARAHVDARALAQTVRVRAFPNAAPASTVAHRTGTALRRRRRGGAAGAGITWHTDQRGETAMARLRLRAISVLVIAVWARALAC